MQLVGMKRKDLLGMILDVEQNVHGLALRFLKQNSSFTRTDLAKY